MIEIEILLVIIAIAVVTLPARIRASNRPPYEIDQRSHIVRRQWKALFILLAIIAIPVTLIALLGH